MILIQFEWLIIKDIILKAQDTIRDGNKRKQVVESAQEDIRSRHTHNIRIQELLKIIGEL